MRRVPGPGRNIQQFVLCVLLHVLLPLLPLAVEFARFRYVRPETATVVAAMYVIAIGVSSRNVLQFGLGLGASGLYAFAFGWIAGSAHIIPGTPWVAVAGIGMAALCHSVERWNRHAVEGRDFLQFLGEA